MYLLTKNIKLDKKFLQIIGLLKFFNINRTYDFLETVELNELITYFIKNPHFIETQKDEIAEIPYLIKIL